MKVFLKNPLTYELRGIISKFTPNLGLSILGVKGAGKSCLYSYLELCHKNKNRIYHSPSDYVLPNSTGAPNNIDELKIQTKEGYVITINDGQDVSGDSVSGQYKKAVDDSDVIIYLFPSWALEENEERKEEIKEIRKKILAQLYLVYFFIHLKETNLENEKKQIEKIEEKSRAKEDKKRLDTVKSKLKLGTHVFIIPTWEDNIPSTWEDKRSKITNEGIKNFFYNSLKEKDENFYNFMFSKGKDAKVKFLNMIEMVKDDNLNIKPLNEMRHKLFEEIVKIIKKQKPYYI